MSESLLSLLEAGTLKTHPAHYWTCIIGEKRLPVRAGVLQKALRLLPGSHCDCLDLTGRHWFPLLVPLPFLHGCACSRAKLGCSCTRSSGDGASQHECACRPRGSFLTSWQGVWQEVVVLLLVEFKALYLKKRKTNREETTNNSWILRTRQTHIRESTCCDAIPAVSLLSAVSLAFTAQRMTPLRSPILWKTRWTDRPAMPASAAALSPNMV